MSVYLFGLHDGHLTAAAERIAVKYGAHHVNYADANGARRGWFEAPNFGAPFDGDRAARIFAAFDRAGTIEKFKKKRTR